MTLIRGEFFIFILSRGETEARRKERGDVGLGGKKNSRRWNAPEMKTQDQGVTKAYNKTGGGKPEWLMLLRESKGGKIVKCLIVNPTGKRQGKSCQI